VVDGVHLIVCLGVPGDRVAPGGPPAETVLTPREREVLAALAAGETGKEIAGELFIAPETVRRHVANARAKLHATTRAHAVVEALRRGEIEL
jgi:DNA-binding CsgD family transcriptional regulator